MAGSLARMGFAFAALALALAAWPFAAPAGEPRRVFVVHSYNPEYIWTHNVNQGLVEALKSHDVILDYHYMDAKRRPSPEWLRQTARDAFERIRSFGPDVVVTVDDAAQEYLVVPYLKGSHRPQVIFCGVNADPAKYGFPASNVSGVREIWHFRDGFKLLSRIVPWAKSAVFLIDSSESGHYIMSDLREDLDRNGPFAVSLAAQESVTRFSEWRRVVERYKGQVDAFAIGLYQSIVDDATGKVMDSRELARWTREASGKPTLGFTDVAMEHEILCGVLESAHEQGFLAGQMVSEVFTAGVRAGELTMRINQKGVIMLNLREAERLGLTIPFELIEAAGVVVQ